MGCPETCVLPRKLYSMLNSNWNLAYTSVVKCRHCYRCASQSHIPLSWPEFISNAMHIICVCFQLSLFFFLPQSFLQCLRSSLNGYTATTNSKCRGASEHAQCWIGPVSGLRRFSRTVLRHVLQTALEFASGIESQLLAVTSNTRIHTLLTFISF